MEKITKSKQEDLTMYKYMYVRATTGGPFSASDYKELIDQHSREGWRFVTAIPAKFVGYGVIKEVDLVFEKEE